jgi:hypothetical protein
VASLCTDLERWIRAGLLQMFVEPTLQGLEQHPWWCTTEERVRQVVSPSIRSTICRSIIRSDVEADDGGSSTF